jgi:hypothetical protein
MPNLPFPNQHPKTDIEDWDPTTVDAPDHTSDKVAKVFQDGAVGAARKLVAIANGDHDYDYSERGATQALKLEIDACRFIIEQISTGAGQDQPWQEWARQLIASPSSIPVEPAGNSLPGGVMPIVGETE